MLLPLPVLKAFGALSATEQEDVRAIVRRHIEACRRLGVPLEYFDRVWIEAIEEVKLSHRRTVVEAGAPPPPDAAYQQRRYQVYDAPRD